jgi:hypothetical protein
MPVDANPCGSWGASEFDGLDKKPVGAGLPAMTAAQAQLM